MRAVFDARALNLGQKATPANGTPRDGMEWSRADASGGELTLIGYRDTRLRTRATEPLWSMCGSTLWSRRIETLATVRATRGGIRPFRDTYDIGKQRNQSLPRITVAPLTS